MKKKIINIFLIQLIVTLVYNGISWYRFVKAKEANPIGEGIQQWIYFFLHLILTVVFCLVLRSKSPDKKGADQTLWLALAAAVFWCLVYLLLEEPIWRYLWQLRKQ